MQVLAGIPAELVDVIQAIILLFLAADIVVRHLFRIRAPAAMASADDLKTITNSYGGRATLMDQIATFLYSIPVVGVVFQLIGYLVATMPDDRSDLSSRWPPRSPSAPCAGS